jgi:hypothetical protein
MDAKLKIPACPMLEQQDPIALTQETIEQNSDGMKSDVKFCDNGILIL